MDNRTLLAIALILLVLMMPALLRPPRPDPTALPVGPDSGLVAQAPDTGGPVRPAPGAADSLLAPANPGGAADSLNPPGARAPAPVDVVVESDVARYRFSPLGARMVSAELLNHQTFAAGESGIANIIPEDSDFLTFKLVYGADTVPLTDWVFQPSSARLTVANGPSQLIWTATRGQAVIRLTYSFEPDRYLFRVRGQVDGLPGSPVVHVGMGPRLRSVDADSAADFRSYGVVTKARSTENLKFSSLSPGELAFLDGPFEWVAVKSKYFLAAYLTIDENEPRFGGARVEGGSRVTMSGRAFRRTPATRVHAEASIPAPEGVFSFEVYVGPQEHHHLTRIGHGLQDVNPYGWILRPIIRPLSILVVRLLLWMHETLSLAYGWVLILFGIAVRLALWPLNQKAMRSSMAMQAIQPEMQAIQQKYKNDRQKMQEEMLKLYRKHGMGPLGPLAGGCFPILLQMPILFTLFFVFLNTIEFRGVPFLWLPDLSLADPLYIIPLLMGGSMFVLSKIGQIGVPPNPQQKVMTYAMPVVFTLLFFRFSSGLNLYYATSTMASMPQQWLIAQERLKKAAAKK